MNSSLEQALPLVGTNPRLRYICACAQRDLELERHERRFYVTPDGESGALRALIDRTNMLYLLGRASSEVVDWVLQFQEYGELFYGEDYAPTVASMAGQRSGTPRSVLFFHATHPYVGLPSRRGRALDLSDLSTVETFTSEHYPTTTFVPRMLELPSVGLFEGQELVALATLIYFDEVVSCGQVGNVLTDPKRRRQGLGREVMHHLMHELANRGVSDLRLEVYADHVACGLYESLGFSVEWSAFLTLLPTSGGSS